MSPAPVVLDVFEEPSGSFRVTLRDPLGEVTVHSEVVATVPGLLYDHDGIRTPRPGEQLPPTFQALGGVPYTTGQPVGEIHLYLAGQRVFTVPPETTEIKFEDGTVHTIGQTAPAA